MKDYEKKAMNERLDRVQEKLNPLFDTEKFDVTKMSVDDIESLSFVGNIFKLATHEYEDFTDKQLTDLEAHADRLVKLFTETETPPESE